jgi:hypothetical protein
MLRRKKISKKRFEILIVSPFELVLGLFFGQIVSNTSFS